jgi:2-succinyl-5-enolpyruvyl-6-hydroxy-3-cyclohexene-1-carboxylate synthase
MPHPKQHIVDLALIFREKGIQQIIISPGSRSAPLIRSFIGCFGESCISIVDERSAGYFALGIAQYTQKPVALVCTSGTAVLNYAPALAEAYYQQVPLIAVTADRPREWIDQQDNQTLRQSGIYSSYIKGSYDLPQVISSEDDLWFAHRIINEAIDLSASPAKGPVHINVPLTEPLYEELPVPSENIRIIRRAEPGISLELPDELIHEWENAERIMIVHGQDFPGSEAALLLPSLLNDGRIVILAENIANIPGKSIISNSNLILSRSRGNSPANPDLVVHSGGQVVSKALTGYLRRSAGAKCWRIGTESGIIDTFKRVTRHIPHSAAAVYRALSGKGNRDTGSSYRTSWQSAASEADSKSGEMIRKASFSDLVIFGRVSQLIPPGSIVALGNSSIIRYSQLFPANEQVSYYSNRGISGIDGCLSSAAGLAHISGKLTLALVGDLGLIYDSNALWNRDLPANLKILVVNNRGGGIFHILKGPSDHPGFKKFIEAHHPVNIHNLAEAFGLDYYYAGDEQTLENQWGQFIQERGRASLLEVRTDPIVSAAAFRQLMSIA